MAFPTSVNSQITDAVTQANVKVLADAPAMALGSLYQTLAQASGMAAQNATANQQAANQVSQAVVTRCVESILGSSAS
ncbi:MAG: RebB like protein [Lysobacterales bacterium 14-68-21]|jgi:hypothetical protein|nr:MAG: RebB like protein [Xanthomonadales bacterium 15-68-25]OZB65995.1 MAG: RebB like protein [Xanthomonadales bacterium 14-68-21]